MAVVKDLGVNSVSFAVEFHQLIKVANIFLSLNYNPKHVKLVITQKSIELCTKKEDSIVSCIFDMTSDAFMPATLCGLSGQFKQSNSLDNTLTLETEDDTDEGPFEVTFRIHVVENFFAEECPVMSNRYMPPIKNHVEYNLLCRSCKRHLNKSSLVFKRVLDKPSSDWQDLASEWFCHRHGDENEAPTCLLPTDLMFCYNRFYINPELINFSELNSPSLMCKRCDAHLGDKSHSRLLNENEDLVFAELMRHAVLFLPVECESAKDEPENDDAASTVVKIIQEQLETALTCKLCFNSKGAGPGVSVLLWVMDAALLRFSKSQRLTKDGSKVSVQPRKTIRMLYAIADETSPLAEKWRKDFSVESHAVEETILWKVADQLLESTRSLPSAHRAWDDLWVGYLPL